MASKRRRNDGSKNGSKTKTKQAAKGCLLMNFLRFETGASFMKPIKVCAVVLMICMCGFANYKHQSSMFENDRHFSHLSNLEREMTFRTEMGLYYSYFKVIVEADSFLEGVASLMNDARTEFPSVINTLQRFNVFPELVIGGAYRMYAGLTELIKLQTTVCWTVERGNGLSPIESCEGMGVPIIFYVNAAFLWNGLVPALLFGYGYLLSNSVHGGIISAACFFFNHGECTRVQWTPPLRETFGYPIFLAQMLYVSHKISITNIKGALSMPIVIMNVCFMLCWQFAQFALLTQIFSLMVMFLLKLIRQNVVFSIIYSHFIALLIAFIVLFGNTMLISSFYAAFLAAALSLLHFHKFIKKITIANLSFVMYCFSVTMDIVVMVFTFFVYRFTVKYVFEIKDDNHIFDILKSKFTSYYDFHTLLYTCAPEFDFLPLKTFVDLSHTLLLPTAAVSTLTVAFNVIRKTQYSQDENGQINYTTIVYNVLQMLSFLAMATLIMRLKLFLTPHLCIVASLVACGHIFRFLKSAQHFGWIVLIISGMTIQGLKNIQDQRNVVGEYSNPPLEELIEWVDQSTPTSAVFTGPMPTMANIMLSTRRAIVNHPHYEDAGVRDRTKQIYSLFSRQSEIVVWNRLKKMKASHVVIGKTWCNFSNRCGIVSIWDKIQPGNVENQPLCDKLQSKTEYMSKVFENFEYLVFKI